MAPERIGWWVRRAEPGTKWHAVESDIAGDAVTRCGRRMAPRISGDIGLEWSEVKPLTRLIGQPQLCHGGCDDGT